LLKNKKRGVIWTTAFLYVDKELDRNCNRYWELYVFISYGIFIYFRNTTEWNPLPL